MARKTLTGMEVYRRLWGGPLRMILPLGPGDSIDEEVVDTRALPFTVEVINLRSPALRERVKNAAVVLGGPNHELNGLAKFCRARGVPYAFNCEYTLKTRWQIARAETPARSPRLLRRVMWEGRQELANLRELRISSAVQCNGTPTYNAYRTLNGNTLLYFDSRTEASMLATPDDLAARIARREQGKPLRLLFSGRLAPMKGADDLPALAKALRARGVPFHLDICGSGPLEASMKREVEREGLSSHVTFRGVLDFATELSPFVRNEIDAFVCCHRQGDPSCTYIETFACGVPIAGYANEAFAGLLERTVAGESVPIGDVDGLADLVARWARPESRGKLAQMGQTALDFARQHTFEATFARRVEHLRSIARTTASV